MASTDTNNLEEMETRLKEIRNRNESDEIHLRSFKIFLDEMKKEESRLETEVLERETRLGRVEMLKQRQNNERHCNKNLKKLLYEYNSITRLSDPDSHKRKKNVECHLETLTVLQNGMNDLKKWQENLIIVQKYKKLQKQEGEITKELQQLVNTFNCEYEAYRKTFHNLEYKMNKLILRLVINADKIRKKMIGKENILILSKDRALIPSNRSTQYSQKYEHAPINIQNIDGCKVPETQPKVEIRGCEQNMTTLSYTERFIQVRTTVSPEEHRIKNDEEISYAVSSVEITQVRNGRREYVANNGCTKKPSLQGRGHDQQTTSTVSPARYSSLAGLNGRALLKQATQKNMFSMPAANILKSIEHEPKVRTSNGNRGSVNESKRVTVLSNLLVKTADKGSSNFVGQATGCVRNEANVEKSENARNNHYSKCVESELVEETGTQDNKHLFFARINKIPPFPTCSNKSTIPKLRKIHVELQNAPSGQMNMKQIINRPDEAKITGTETVELNLEPSSSHITVESSKSENARNKHYSKCIESELVEETETQDNRHSLFARINKMPPFPKCSNNSTILKQQQIHVESQNPSSGQMNMKQITNRPDEAKITGIETVELNLEPSSSHITIESSNENDIQSDKQLLETTPLHAAPKSNDNSLGELNRSPSDNLMKRKDPVVAQKIYDDNEFDFYNFQTPKRLKTDESDPVDNDYSDLFSLADILNSSKGDNSETKIEEEEDVDFDYFNLNSPAAIDGDKKKLFDDMSDFFNI